MSPKNTKTMDFLSILSVYKKRLLILGLILIIMFLVMDLNSRLTELEELQLERDRMATEAFVYVETRVVMETKVAYADSSDAVEDYAESQQMTNDDGRILIVPLADSNITPTPKIISTPSVLIYEKIEVWKELFFGD